MDSLRLSIGRPAKFYSGDSCRERLRICLRGISIREEIFLDTPGEQLVKMQKIFGKNNSECLEIWQRLFLDSGRPSRSHSVMSHGILDNLTMKSFVDFIWYSRSADLMSARN